MRKREIDEFYRRPPTSEEIDQDLQRRLFRAWQELTNLHEYLSALHQDGLLEHLGDGLEYLSREKVEAALKELWEFREKVDPHLGGFDVGLPASEVLQ